jgi:hypothetical protein
LQLVAGYTLNWIDCKLRLIWPSGFRGDKLFFRNRPIRKKNCLWWSCLLTDWDEMKTIHSGPFIDASYQVMVHLVKWFQSKRFFRNRPIRENNCMWRPCMLTDRDEMSILYREPSINAFYEVWFHLARRFQRRIFF